MEQQHQHTLSIVDFSTTAHGSTFVKFTGYDAKIEKKFSGEVKFLGGNPYGDIIHPDRSTLSDDCRQYVQNLLVEKFHSGEFQ
ncbi:hypothetical protein [Halalkalibacter krulwichiae]|uniref:Uncharacterized protein n=1 Tax=Halalkalibacter krulwichiae TaxID=199441 RepID=A0A1X9M8T5_9BACI|nr:hypothetical protein [Halalkalibacter krulwichiae]ARK29818.1 hypothetical protein BkAM31D_08070 [Halalkalibacter krulwichiae]